MEVNPNSTPAHGSNNTTNALGNIQRPGEYLRQIRINQKLEPEFVSSELKIPLKTLLSLEQDEYQVLPEATFIKGYYRTYAKFLGVDASNIIQRFDEIYANDTGLLPNHALNNSPIKMMGKLPGSNRERNRKWLKRGLITVAIIAVIWALIALVQNWTSKNDVVEQETPVSDVQIFNLDGGNTNGASASGDQLQLSFSSPTSVNIVDATGKVLATGRQANALSLNGEAPFQIRLDDATVVSLKLNNDDIPLSSYTVNGKADFRLSR